MKHRFFVYSLAALIPAFAGNLYAAAGQVDPSFGTGGVVTTDFFGGFDTPTDVAVQPDGKIVVVGRTDNGSESDTGLTRYNADGTLDPSFGPGGPEGNGKVILPPIGPVFDRAAGVAIQPDGKIVITGSTDPDGDQVFVARYNSDGSLDTSFDGDGLMTAAPSTGSFSEGDDLVFQPDGKIVVSGSTFIGEHRFLVMRLNADGSLDTSFDGDGFAITPVGGGAGRSVALQSDGKILVGGGAYTVVRYNPDGSLDTSFAGDGIATAAFVDPGAAGGMARSDSGKIVVVGYINNGSTNDLALALFNPDGSLDSSFDGDGKLQISLGSGTDEGNAVVFQADGKILVSASSFNVSERDLTIARFLENGSLDTTFGGGDGFEFTNIGSVNDQPNGFALQPDGRAVMVGDNEANFAVVRYQGDSGDLSITKAADATQVEVDDPVTYTLTVKNNGTSALGGVTVTDGLDSRLTLQSASVGSGTCSGTTTVTCNLGTLAAGASADVTLIARPNAAGTIANQATASAQAVDSNPADNTSASVSLTVTAAAAESSGGCSLLPN